jgi:hypothetical protein
MSGDLPPCHFQLPPHPKLVAKTLEQAQRRLPIPSLRPSLLGFGCPPAWSLALVYEGSYGDGRVREGTKPGVASATIVPTWEQGLGGHLALWNSL